MRIRAIISCITGAGLMVSAIALTDADKPTDEAKAAKTFQQANKEAAKKRSAPRQMIMGLKQAPGVETVVANCIGCHSPRLIAAHHLSRKRWEETLVTMNKKHGLWKLSPDMRKKITRIP